MTIALILSLIHLIISYGTYSVFFNNPENLGEALGEVFAIIIFIAYSVIFAILILVASGLTLAFVIPLLKINGKKWYSFVILGVAIATILTAALAIAMIPVVSKIASETRNASSGSSSALSASLALLYL